VTVSSTELARLRARFEGCRARLVTNRRSAEVEHELEQAIGLRIKWVDCAQPRRLNATKLAVRHGAVQLILVATSFVGHAVDNALKLPCRRAKVPFIPVENGSAQACLLALRTFMLHERR
jgi:hypothetical protein